jgi:hypothetical protein
MQESAGCLNFSFDATLEVNGVAMRSVKCIPLTRDSNEGCFDLLDPSVSEAPSNLGDCRTPIKHSHIAAQDRSRERQ